MLLGGQAEGTAVDTDGEATPLTFAAVSRASLPVAALFDWVLLQLRLALALSDSESNSGKTSVGSEDDEATAL